MPYNAPSEATIPYPATTVDGTYKVALPNQPRGVAQMLEAKLDETLNSIKSIDATMCELRVKRAKCIESLSETTAELSEKCDVARRLIDASKVSSQNY